MGYQISKDYKSSTHIARVLSPKGVYPAKSVVFTNCVYVADEDLAFSVVRTEQPMEDEPYSELQFLSRSEVRLYGALMLSVDREESYVAFYPFPYGIRLLCDDADGSVDELLKVVKPLILKAITAPDVHHPGYPAPARNPYRSTDIPLPALVGGTKYDFREKGIDYELAQRLFDSIDPRDDLAVRGVATFMKAAMLHFHYEFFEEATNTLFISLEASFRLVLRRLRESGKVNPTAKDAATFIHDAFSDVYRLEKYFEEDYEKRIFSFHPESRIGTYAFPPLAADDYYCLYDGLLEVFAFLLTGYVHPKYRKASA